MFSLSLPLFLLFVILFGLLAGVFYFIAGIISFWTGSFSTLLESILRQGTEVTKPLMLTFISFFKGFVVYSYFMVNTLLVVFSNYLGKNCAKHKEDFHVAKQYQGLQMSLQSFRLMVIILLLPRSFVILVAIKLRKRCTF
jgi:hypothetical protein